MFLSPALGAARGAEPSCLGAHECSQVCVGGAGDTAGWAALGSRRSLFPSWEPGALLPPGAESPSPAGLWEQKCPQQHGQRWAVHTLAVPSEQQCRWQQH